MKPLNEYANGPTYATRRGVGVEVVALAIHGIVDIRAWRCACGATYRYPAKSCPLCQLPYPRRCQTVNCDTITQYSTGDEVQSFCEGCTRSVLHNARLAAFRRSDIPGDARNAAELLGDFRPKFPMETALGLVAFENFVRFNRGDVAFDPGRGPSLFLGGAPGRGKTWRVARSAYYLFVEAKKVDSFAWHTHETFVMLYREATTFLPESRGDGSDAARRLRTLYDVGLFVLDDAFTRPMTIGQAGELGAILRTRLDHERPTVVISNIRPAWDTLFPGHGPALASRWARQYNLTLEGVDMRRNPP